jgi:hypothetical protein
MPETPEHTVAWLVRDVTWARAAKAAANERLGLALRQSARQMVHEHGLTRVETGRLLGISHQRVCVLLAETAPPADDGHGPVD